MEHSPRRFNLDRLDRALSQRARSLVDPVPKECFRNALMASMHFDGVRYVEGWAALSMAPILTGHGWLETAQGSIIECTTESYLAYYPLRRWTPRAAYRAVCRKEVLPLLEFEFPGKRAMEVHYKAMRDEYGIDWKRLRATLKEIKP